MRTYTINYREARNTSAMVFETSVTAKSLKEAKEMAHEEFDSIGYTVVNVSWDRF